MSAESLLPTNDNTNPQQGNQYSVPAKNEGALVAGSGQKTLDDAGLCASAVTAKKFVKVPPTKKDSRKLFVGGIASNVTDEEFLEFFKQFGTVVDSVVMFDKETRRSRGFGFVTFEDPTVAQAVLSKSKRDPHTITINGKVCELKAAQPKALAPMRTEHAPMWRSKPGRAMSPSNPSSLGNSMGSGHVGTAVIPAQNMRVPSTVPGPGYDVYCGGPHTDMAPSPWMQYPPHGAPSYQMYPEQVGFYGPPDSAPPHQLPYPVYGHVPNVGAYSPAVFPQAPYGVSQSEPHGALMGYVHGNGPYFAHAPASHDASVPYYGMHPFHAAYAANLPFGEESTKPDGE